VSIKNRQITRTMNKIIQDALKKGIYPSIEQINYKLRKWMKEHVPGLPLFKIRPAKPHSRSSSKDYNNMLTEIHTDLNDIFDETKDQFKRILVNFDYNDTERKRLKGLLDKLEARIKNLLLLQRDTDGYTESFYDTFNDFSKINLDNTTAQIDLNNNEIKLMEISNDLQKLDLTNSIGTITITPTGLENSSMESISNCFDDNLNSAWVHRISSKEAQQITVYLDFQISSDATPINQISIIPHSPRSMTVEISYSSNKNSWSTLPNQSERIVTGPNTWNFDEIEAKYIRIKLTKHEPDSYDIDKYSYYFGLKNVSIYKVSFVNSCTFQTMPFTSKNGKFTQVSLQVDQEVPKGTDIEYYIAPYNGDGDHVWQPISPIGQNRHPNVIELSNLQYRSTQALSPSEPSTEIFRGIPIYICNNFFPYEGNIPIDGTDKLYRGVMQWKREHYYFMPSDNEWIPTLKDWTKFPLCRYNINEEPVLITENDITTSYVDILRLGNNIANLNFEGTHNKYADDAAGHYYLFTTSIYSENSVRATCDAVISNCIVRVYNNRVEVPSTAVNNKLRFKYELYPGWNTLQVVVYRNSNDPISVNLDLDKLLRNSMIDIALRSPLLTRAEIYPLLKTNLYNLKYNVLPSNHDYYCVDGNSLILNYNPYRYYPDNITEISNANIFKIKYGTEYKFSTDVNTVSSIVMMAILKRDNYTDTVTPKIKSYVIKAL
jgi:hypothetical protein